MMKGSPENASASCAMLYSPEQRRRRDESAWTLVQGALAPLQFVACLVSIVLIQQYLSSGDGLALANASVLVKIGLLYLIMITGAIWEKRVFGQYLFAPAFFWEDVVSMGVIALHSAYLYAWWNASLTPTALMALALCAYLAYVINALQFLFKLRAARLAGQSVDASLAAIPAPVNAAVRVTAGSAP